MIGWVPDTGADIVAVWFDGYCSPPSVILTTPVNLIVCTASSAFAFLEYNCMYLSILGLTNRSLFIVFYYIMNIKKISN